jgi:hypothetical protein
MDNINSGLYVSEKENVVRESSINVKPFKYISETYNHDSETTESSEGGSSNSGSIDQDNNNYGTNNRKPSIKNRNTVDISTGYLKKISYKVKINRKKRVLLFWVLMITSLFLNTDHGTIPAAIEEIEKDLKIDKTLVGTFGSLVYMGTAVGAMFLSFFINKINRKYMVAISFCLSGILIFSFTLAKSLWFLFVNRFLVGFSQSLISIYIPVWIDQYSPIKFKTIFMAVFNISSAVGVMLGYLLTMLIKNKYNVRIYVFNYFLVEC